jgi:hypothetical protein
MFDKRLKIKFQNPQQIINMGGPWIGDLFVGDLLIDINVIIDNVIYKQDLDSYFFVKYHNISKWQKDNYFTINLWDRANAVKKESGDKFDMLYIKEGLNKDEILIYNSFHNRDIDSTTFKIDKLIKNNMP